MSLPQLQPRTRPKLFAWPALALLAALCPGSARAQGLAAAPETCTVEGTVVRAADGQPLRRARVRMIRTVERNERPTRQEQAPTATTDTAGRFSLTGLAPGRYRVFVERNGFVRAEYGQRYPNRPGTQLALDRGQKVRELLFRLTAAAVISGRVTDEEGEPVANASVQALRQVYQRGQRAFSNAGSVGTDDRGEFRLFGLAPGRYYLSAAPSGTMQVPLPMPREAGATGETYGVAFYPGTSDPLRAAAIQVAAGEELSQMNMTLAPQRVVRVRGKILPPSGWEITGQRGGGMQAMLMRRGIVSGGRGFQLQGDVDLDQMQFEFRNVTAGSYTLMIHAAVERRQLAHQEPLEVSSTDLDGVTVVMRAPSEVSGKVRVEGAGEQPKLTGMRVSFSPETETGFGEAGARWNQDGSFTASLAPETYRVSMQGMPPEFYLKSVRVGGEEFVETGLPIPAKAGGQLEIVISAAGARVEGQVLDSDSLPVSGAYVALVPTGARRRAHPSFFRSATTDATGMFAISGIPPGDYKLFSWDDVEPGAWQDPEFLARYEDRGISVQLSESAVRSVELKLLPPR